MSYCDYENSQGEREIVESNCVMRDSIFPVIVQANQNLMESCCRKGDTKFKLIMESIRESQERIETFQNVLKHGRRQNVGNKVSAENKEENKRSEQEEML